LDRSTEEPPLGETFATDAAFHLVGHPEGTDVASFGGFLGVIATAFPDFQFEIDEFLDSGDTIVMRWTGQGTHQGELMGLPGTGRAVSIEGCAIHQIADGRMVRRWEQYDRLGMLQQIGAAPGG
jgi:steroid delta-isomerase-like uncharacterized protein